MMSIQRVSLPGQAPTEGVLLFLDELLIGILRRTEEDGSSPNKWILEWGSGALAHRKEPFPGLFEAQQWAVIAFLADQTKQASQAHPRLSETADSLDRIFHSE